MKRAIVALSSVLLCAPASAQSTTHDATPARSEQPDPASARRAILARDPASLPRAAEGRWKDFDPRTLTPEAAPPEFLAAREALAAGDVPAALGRLHATLEREPDFPPALHQCGVLYFQLQRYGDARACFERYLAVAPARVAETRGLAHALYSLGRYAEARAHYERVLAAAPKDVETRRGLALSKYRLGDVDGALVDLTLVLERDPRHADAWTWKAQMLLDLDETEDALAAAEKARDLAPWSPRPWFALATALTDLGRDAEARTAQARFALLSRADQEIRRLEAHLELDPGDAPSRHELARALAEVGNRPALREQLGRLVAERPGDVPVRILALDLFDRAGDVEAGAVAARELARAGEDSVAAWKRLEVWYAARRDRAKQIEAGERWRRASRP